MWLDRKESGEQQFVEELERMKTKQESPKFQKSDFVKTKNVKIKAVLLSQTRRCPSPDRQGDPCSSFWCRTL